MESITLQEFNKQAGKAFIILVLFIGFSIYRIVKSQYSLEHIVIIFVSILGIIGVKQLLNIAEQKVDKGNSKMKLGKSIFLEQVLVFGLGILSIYIFITKGAYGSYLLFKNFTFGMLIYRLIIIAASYQLVVAVSKIQAVFKAIQSDR